MMMGNDLYSSTNDFDSHLDASKEEMENLILHHNPQPQPSSNAGFHSTLSSPTQICTSTVDDHSGSSHPLTLTPRLDHHCRNPNFSTHSNLDPLSDADSMYQSFDFGASSEIKADIHASFSQASSSDSEYIHISVSDPQKVLETSNSLVPGSGSYYTYLITTTTNLPEFQGTKFIVRRRFSEVVTLADRLSESFRGYFIPLRPDKSVMESQLMQKSEFVEQRRVAIEKYLKKLANHPAIRGSEELRIFLKVQGKLPLPKTTDVASRILNGVVKLPGQLMKESSMTPQAAVQPAKGGRDLLRLFKELRQAVVNDWGGTKPPIVEEDKEFLEKKERLDHLERQLSNVSEQAEALVKAQQDIRETMGELGLSFVKLTKFENEGVVYECQRTRAADMKSVATAAVKASRLYRELNAQTVKHLDKLHEYLGMMLSVDNAFADRSNALLTVQTLVSEISSLQSRIEKSEHASSKILGGDRSRMQKVGELKESLKVTEDARYCAVREYERIKENNKRELARLDIEMRTDFLSMLKGFVANQAGYAERMASVWGKVAEETIGYTKSV